MELIRLWVKWLGQRLQRRLTRRAAVALFQRLHLSAPPPCNAAVAQRISTPDEPDALIPHVRIWSIRNGDINVWNQ